MSTPTLRRWGVPAAIGAAVLAVGVGTTLVQASDGESLPPKSAAELIADVARSNVDGLSGTVVTSADLGLPSVLAGGDDTSMSSLMTGEHTMRIWYAGPDKVRAALLGTLGESDVIRNGDDVWTWSSQDKTATHTTLPKDFSDGAQWPPAAVTGAPVTPHSAASSALSALGRTTDVSTDGTAEVAGRDAYELVVAPTDDRSTIGEIRLAVDGETGVPLRTQIFARGADDPAFEIAFARVEFEQPPAEHFTFTPPDGVTVTETGPIDLDGGHREKAADAPEITVLGEGWTSVIQLSGVDLAALAEDGDDSEAGRAAAMASALLESLPQVSGDWGTGRLLTTTLLNALITDDGRILVGAVTPDVLTELAGS